MNNITKAVIPEVQFVNLLVQFSALYRYACWALFCQLENSVNRIFVKSISHITLRLLSIFDTLKFNL